MPKNKKNVEQTNEVQETLANVAEQAVNANEKIASTSEKSTASEMKEESLVKNNEAIVVQKSGGKGLALLALLVAFAVGGAGYYFGNQKSLEIEQQLSALSQKAEQASSMEMPKIDIPTFEVEKAQIATLAENYQKATARIAQLEQEQTIYTNQINGLQTQLQKISGVAQSDSVVWKLSDADFLLNNAVRKLVLDNDIETTQHLLKEADSVLAQVANPQVVAVRAAIKNDLAQLANVNVVDQNAIMQRLTALANRLDDLPMIANESGEEIFANGEVSNSLQDWQKNLEKSASSFLDHFIRVSDRNKTEEKAFIAPNQEIYLRENIRLRLQIAILAVPRQQNELYKQSLEAVSTWIRSYFEPKNENVKNFLKELDDLAEQSVYVDAPNRLQGLEMLEQLLNKIPQAVEKIEIKAETALEQPAETPKAEQPAQNEQPATEQ